MAEDYKIACKIRNYVNIVSKQDNLTDEIKEWIKWANKKANWLDTIIDEENVDLKTITDEEIQGLISKMIKC